MTTSVDVQGMQLAQEDFQQALDQMNSVYSAMSEEADNLSASWSGMAASAFGQALGAWLDDLYQIRQELVVMTESLSTHTGIYSDANEASQDVVNAFQHGLQGLESLPAQPMVAMRAVEGKLLLPEKGVLARRETVEGELLPTRLDREEAYLPARQLEDVPEQPLLPDAPLLPEEPLQPRRLLLPEEPLRPVLRDLPANP